jgi:hypothetical protein
MIMNMADEVHEVHLKFDRRCSKLIEKDHDDQGGFDDVRMAHNLIKMHIHGLVEHITMLFKEGQGRLSSIEVLKKYH